ncbi:MAG: toprim domain-containing protein, partial [candidate division Zixibacteria bacterium]|nr:toprim domain-containing protein [candidate division Zixibacteria bacterium]
MIAQHSSMDSGRREEIDLQLLKQTVSILDLARERGLDPGRHGNGTWKVNCPLHDDGKASLVITPGKNLWHCFGCDKGGSNIDFIVELDHVSVRDAILTLADKSHAFIGRAAELPERLASPGKPPAARHLALDEPSTLTPARQKLLNKVAEFYHKTFLQDPEGRDYLRERGLTDAALYESFKIGCANGTIFDAIPSEGDTLDDLKAVGIVNERGQEHFRDCVIFPIFDPQGNVTEMYGRKMHVTSAQKGKAKPSGKSGRACRADLSRRSVAKTEASERRREPVRHLYLPGPHRGVWNHYALRMPSPSTGKEDRAGARASLKTVLLTESIIDAAAIWQAGWRHVIPCYGSQGFTPEHVDMIRESRIERLILVMDGDDSGRNAVEKIRRKIDGIDIDIRVARLPEGEDPANYLHTHSVEEFGDILAAACGIEAAADNRLLAAVSVTPLARGFRLAIEDRAYEVINTEGKSGKVRATIKAVTRDRLRFHIDTVDLYLARSRKSFAADAARLYGMDSDTMTMDLNRIIQASENHLKQNAPRPDDAPAIVTDPEIEKAARAFSRRPDLLDRIARDVEKCGYIGERANVLATYLTMTSRRMLEPLAMMILSGSGAG